MTVGSSLSIALRALSRNKLQTALTTIGMTIGVATVLTMIAIGTGAEAAIEQQVRAAGMNLIVVTAGNYKAKTEDDGGGVVDHQARMENDRADVVQAFPPSLRFGEARRSAERGGGRPARHGGHEGPHDITMKTQQSGFQCCLRMR